MSSRIRDYFFQTFAICTLVTLMTSAAFAEAAVPHEAQKVNPALVEFQKRFSNPKLVRLGDRVYSAFGFDYSNFSIIEGADGIILVDTGWFPDNVQPAWDAFRKISKKPVKAIIYTHTHGDHTGGGVVFEPDTAASLVIYGPQGWREYLHYRASSLLPLILSRGFAQVGLVLPLGEEGNVGSGIGPAVQPGGTRKFITPTVTVDQKLELEIAGIRIVLIPTPGDIQSNMMVWLPDDKTLFTGDVLGGALPYISTARFEPDRDARGFVQSLELALSLNPERVVPGHGRLLTHRADVIDNLQANIDIIRFLADQVERQVVKGYSADQIIETLKLPPSLLNHPDLQPHYHTLAWIIRGLALKLGGFVGDVQDLVRHNDVAEARRLIAILGGSDTTIEHAQEALRAGDPRWAMTLASYVLLVEPEHTAARRSRITALQHIAATTVSANERNYALTAVVEEVDGVSWDKVLNRPATVAAKVQSSKKLLSSLRSRFKAEASGCKPFVVSVNIVGEADNHNLVSRSCTLFYSDTPSKKPDTEITLQRGTLNDLWAKKITWIEALDNDLIQVGVNDEFAHAFVRLID